MAVRSPARTCCCSGTALPLRGDERQGEFTTRHARPRTLRAARRGGRFPRRSGPIDAAAEPRDLGPLTLEVSAVSESLIVSAAQVEIPLSAGVLSGDGDHRRGASGETDRHRRRCAARRPRADRGPLGRAGHADRHLPARRRVGLHAGLRRRHPGERLRWRFRLRAPLRRQYRSHRDRPRAAERALRIERDRLGRPHRDPRQRAAARGGLGRRRELWHQSSRVLPPAPAATGSGAARRPDRQRRLQRTPDRGRRGVTNDATSATKPAPAAAGAATTAPRFEASSASGATIADFPGPFGSNPAGIYTGIDTVAHGKDDRRMGSIGGTVPSGRGFARTARSPGTTSTATISARRAFPDRHRRGDGGSPGPDRHRGPARLRRVRRRRAAARARDSTYITDDLPGESRSRAACGVFRRGALERAPPPVRDRGVRLEDIHRDPVAALEDRF